MHFTAHSYSMFSKGIQIAALLFLFLLVASKGFSHVDIIDFTSLELEIRNENRQEVEHQKDIDRTMNPDISDRERDQRDRDLESGISLGAA